MDAIRKYIILCTSLALVSCSSTRVVKTLAPGEKQLSASLGGPMIMFSGAPVFFPLTSIAYAHGLDSTLTATGAIHTTDLLFGVIHAEGAVSIKAYENKSEKFGVTVSPAMHVMVDTWKGNLSTYPQLETLIWWKYSEKQRLLYGGLGTWIELNKQKAHGVVQTNEVMPWVMVGHQFIKPNWTWSVEAKYLGFQHSSSKLVVDYISPGGYGALGLYVGLSRRLGK